jgi:type II secretory pathway component PulF
VFQRMFFEFQIALPAATQLVIDISNWPLLNWAIQGIGSALILGCGGPVFACVAFGLMERWWPIAPEDSSLRRFSIWTRRTKLLLRALAVLVMCMVCWPFFGLVLLTPLVLHFLGWLPRDFPGIWLLFRRYDGALVMRGLALSVRRGVPMPQALALLEQVYPLRQVTKQLHRAGERVAQGQSWCESLRRTGMIGRADAAILTAAERAGNLEWALGELADSALRRQTYWIQAVVQIAFPILLLALGMFVTLFAVGMFLPLISLVQGLTLTV